ncbi:hypothetical protein [Streptomyces sp. NPDC059247]|uniref:hypothetical protein n=1 Tax=Streptomyces sp. NPDC059247 TaxID=3346790 RepID=UPI00367BD179
MTCPEADPQRPDQPALTAHSPGSTRTWLVDWARAARGPAWADTVLWGQRLVLDGGQTPERAARRCERVPAFARAPREAVVVLAEADARSWEAWRAYGTSGLDRTVAAARTWADHWQTP